MRESWSGRYGFFVASAGSAVGFANLWHFPKLVGLYGGGCFLLFYLLFLVVLTFPIFVAEVALGRTTKRGPVGSLLLMSGERRWSAAGKGLLAIGFTVSSLYGVLASWVAGYLYEAVRGGLSESSGLADWLAMPGRVLLFFFLFKLLSMLILLCGVRRGIERANRVIIPLLTLLLIVLAVRGLMLPDPMKALGYLFRPNIAQISLGAVLAALSQAFFTLSLGQGTMITYGSYLRGSERLVSSCLPVLLFDLATALLSTIAIVTVAFAAGSTKIEGAGVLFDTIPALFLTLPLGYLLCIAFFLFIFLAALSSQISALEPLINYFMIGRSWSRAKAVAVATGGAFLLGVPSALSFSLLRGVQLWGRTFFEWVNFLAFQVGIPLGALTVVIFMGWVWGWHSIIEATRAGGPLFGSVVKYLSPFLLLLILIYGILG